MADSYFRDRFDEWQYLIFQLLLFTLFLAAVYKILDHELHVTHLVKRLLDCFTLQRRVPGAAGRYILRGMIEEIRQKISAGQFEFSKHAVDQSILRRVSVREIREAILGGEIIEDYPDDKYGPSCLVFGHTEAGRPLHVQCSYPSRPLVKIVTLYEPDADLWVDFKVRR